MIQIPLKRRDGSIAGLALVDDEDAHLAELGGWYLHSSGYVRRSYYPEGKRGGTHTTSLHREVLKLQRGDRRRIDHVNHNPLDNRRSNLRLVTHAQNHQNRGSRRNSSSRYRGVSWRQDIGMWQAYAVLNGIQQHLGFFHDEHEAGLMAAIYRVQNMPFTVETEALALLLVRRLVEECENDQLEVSGMVMRAQELITTL